MKEIREVETGNVTKKGFTLIELLVAMVILLIVIALIYGIFINARHVQTAEEQLAGFSTEARDGLDQMVRELRMAGQQTGHPGFEGICNDTQGNIELVNADSSSVEFEGDVDLNGNVDRIRYFYNSANKVLYRQELKIPPYDTADYGGWVAFANRCGPPPVSITTNAAASAAAPQQPVAYGISSFSLAFYNASGADITSTANAQLSSISSVGLTVTAASASNPNQQRTVTVQIKLPNLGASGRLSGGAGGVGSLPGPLSSVTTSDPGVCGYLNVSWSASTEPGLSGYMVYYRLANATDWQGSLPVGLQTYTDISGLQNGSSYIVGVAAVNQSGAGAITNASPITINDSTNPSTPTGIWAINSPSSITLGWNPAPDVDGTINHSTTDLNGHPYPVSGYNIYRGTDDNFNHAQFLHKVSPFTNTTYIDTSNLLGCTHYNYWVQAQDLCLNNGTAAEYNPYESNNGATNTTVFSNTVTPPQAFYPGGGTGYFNGTGYVNFAGIAANDVSADNLWITYTTGSASCPAGQPSTFPPSGWTTLPGKNNTLYQNPVNPISPGVSFTGGWDGVQMQGSSWKYSYSFCAYSQNGCGVYSNALPGGYTVSQCSSPCNGKRTDPSWCPYHGGAYWGMPGSCIYPNIQAAGPIAGLACNQVRLYWITKQGSPLEPPSGCNGQNDSPTCSATGAYGTGTDCDFDPDYGQGGWLIGRAVNNSGTSSIGSSWGSYQPLTTSNNPATGPAQPFLWIDPNIDTSGAIPYGSCTDSGKMLYRDRCGYQYALDSTDCAGNLSPQAQFQSNAGGPEFAYTFSPGVINAPTSASSGYYTEVTGPKQNQVLIYLRNTATAVMDWLGSIFTWSDSNALLSSVQFCNPGTTSDSLSNATACTPNKPICSATQGQPCWTTLWPNSSSEYNDTYGDDNGTNVTFDTNATMAASPDITTGHGAITGRVLLTFKNSNNHPEPMNGQQTITMTPEYFNHSTTIATNATCPPVDQPQDTWYNFSVVTTPGPAFNWVTQDPPSDSSNQSGYLANTNNSSVPTPPNGQLKSAQFDPGGTFPYYDSRYLIGPDYSDPSLNNNPYEGVSVTANISATNDPVNSVVLYYAVTNRWQTSPPVPEDSTGNVNVQSPTQTNVSGVSYTSVSLTSSCGTSCTGANSYSGWLPSETSLHRVWYYILAYDSHGNYTLAPNQISATTVDTAYTYDTKWNSLNYLNTSIPSLSGGNVNMTLSTSRILDAISSPSNPYDAVWFWDYNQNNQTENPPICNTGGSNNGCCGDNASAGTTFNIEVTQDNSLGQQTADTGSNVSSATSVMDTCGSRTAVNVSLPASTGIFVTPSVSAPMYIYVSVNSSPLSYSSLGTCEWKWDGNNLTVVSGTDCSTQ